ncbi:hypothetical protein GQ457_08G026230 [Hibiscus cannabinus]
MCKTNSRIPVRFLSIDTQGRVSIPSLSEYRYPHSSIDTLSCRSAFNAGRKLPNGSIDDLTYQNGWKSVRWYKNKLLKLQQQQEQHPKVKIKFKSSFVLNCQTLVTQSVIFIPIHLFGLCELIVGKIISL